mmetsp:Transcript_3050/g.8278  ORF Transcript_3050/g.8278 Transcript_3050/m.8278 type:complete len:213 (-) Transcript_3050:1228-1866(-)
MVIACGQEAIRCIPQLEQHEIGFVQYSIAPRRRSLQIISGAVLVQFVRRHECDARLSVAGEAQTRRPVFSKLVMLRQDRPVFLSFSDSLNVIHNNLMRLINSVVQIAHKPHHVVSGVPEFSRHLLRDHLEVQVPLFHTVLVGLKVRIDETKSDAVDHSCNGDCTLVEDHFNPPLHVLLDYVLHPRRVLLSNEKVDPNRSDVREVVQEARVFH